MAYVYDEHARFKRLCNLAIVDIEPIAPPEIGLVDAPGRPRQRPVSVHDNGMGDPLRYDAERLRILVERHFLHTGSKRAQELLDDWELTLSRFVKVTPRDYRRALLDLRAEEQVAKTVAAE
jgi:glutamate synthase (NADPH/NADH) large chain